MTTNIPATWCNPIAEELHRIAYDLGNVVNAKGDLPEPNYVHLHIQPTGNEDEQIAAIDDLGIALTGKPGDPHKMSDGTYHYRADAGRGPVMVRLYTSIETARAERMLAEREAADKDAEIKRLRALVAELEAGKPSDPTGLAYSRADDEPEGDVTQQLGHRIEPHVGAVTEQGLVDETPCPPECAQNWTRASDPLKHVAHCSKYRAAGEVDPDASMEAHYDAEMDRAPELVHMDQTTGESWCGLAATTPHKGSLVWVGVTCKDCNNQAPF